MQLPFVKYHGAGNDFILIDDRREIFPTDPSAIVPYLCHRMHGIGADGVILLQGSDRPPFRMRIFNADGSEPAMCGNGLRCFVDFLHGLGLVEHEVSVETASGVLQCRWGPEQVAVNLGRVRLITQSLPLLVSDQWFDVHIVDSGVPHGVIFVDDVQQICLKTLGPQIRHHAVFAPHGVNVNIASVQKGGSIEVRTYERGVEAETLACGTGVAAVVWVASFFHCLPEVVPIITQGRQPMAVRRLDTQEMELIGPVARVFEGYLPLCQAMQHSPLPFP